MGHGERKMAQSEICKTKGKFGISIRERLLPSTRKEKKKIKGGRRQSGANRFEGRTKEAICCSNNGAWTSKKKDESSDPLRLMRLYTTQQEVSKLSYSLEYYPELKQDYVLFRHLNHIKRNDADVGCFMCCYKNNWQKVSFWMINSIFIVFHIVNYV